MLLARVRPKLTMPLNMRLYCSIRHSITTFRSPGGTPLISVENLDSGEGLAPLMTRALRKKFKNARSPPLAAHPEEYDCEQPV
jgi:hypothetical protein